MESTGKAGAIQVTQETRQILEQFGYTFIERGLVMVKGKGELLTFYLQGKTAIPPPKSVPSSPTKIVQPIKANEGDTNGLKRTTEESISPSLVKNGSTESPAHLTSVSSSTTSPNSVRLNQDFVDKQNIARVVVECDEVETTSNKVVKNASVSSDDVDVQTPLLSSHSNAASSNVELNHFSINEKDSLLDNVN